jgi:hypothetical protein
MSPSPSPPAQARVARARPDAADAPDASGARPGLTRLLRDLGPALRRAAGPDTAATQVPRDAEAVLSTGIPELDALTGGGLAAGRLSEIHGPAPSGRTSVALSLLGRATAEGALVAWIDGGDAFHPASAAAAGVRLERVLWVRPPGIAEAVRSAERLLAARGFAAVVLDTGSLDARETSWEAQPAGVWQRLVRAAAASATALIALSGSRRVTGSHADLALSLRATDARFTGTPSLFEGLEIEAEVARRRRGPLCGPVPLRLPTRLLRGP